MKSINKKVVIVGSGPAGYTAAIYLGRAGLEPLIVAGPVTGGQLMIASEIDNYPGYDDTVSGFEMMDKMYNQAVKMGAEFIEDLIIEVDFSKTPFTLKGSEHIFTCDAVIISTGASAKWLNLPSETEYQNKGISACATCDGFFFKDKEVAVVGGGSTALEDALYLSGLCRKVHLIHRRDQFKGEKILQEKVIGDSKIEIHYDCVVEEFLGDGKKLSGIKIKNTKTDDLSEIEVSGAFIAIGYNPNTKAFKGAITIDDDGYIVTPLNGTETSVEGVFAAGDVRDKIYRQAIVAAGFGCMAAIDVQDYLTQA